MNTGLIASILVGLAVALAVICSIGVGIMNDALKRLHFSAPLTSISMGLIAIAVWVDDKDWQARLKVVLIALVLFVMNSILSHSTGRAIRIRRVRHFEPQPEEKVRLITRDNPTGVS